MSIRKRRLLKAKIKHRAKEALKGLSFETEEQRLMRQMMADQRNASDAYASWRAAQPADCGRRISSAWNPFGL